MIGQNLPQELSDLEKEGLYKVERVIKSAQGGAVVTDEGEVINMCANNYLGLANYPRIVAAAKKAIDEYGVGPGAVHSPDTPGPQHPPALAH